MCRPFVFIRKVLYIERLINAIKYNNNKPEEQGLQNTGCLVQKLLLGPVAQTQDQLSTVLTTDQTIATPKSLRCHSLIRPALKKESLQVSPKKKKTKKMLKIISSGIGNWYITYSILFFMSSNEVGAFNTLDF